jgi:hypothetical protein
VGWHKNNLSQKKYSYSQSTLCQKRSCEFRELPWSYNLQPCDNSEIWLKFVQVSGVIYTISVYIVCYHIVTIVTTIKSDKIAVCVRWIPIITGCKPVSTKHNNKPSFMDLFNRWRPVSHHKMSACFYMTP